MFQENNYLLNKFPDRILECCVEYDERTPAGARELDERKDLSAHRVLPEARATLEHGNDLLQEQGKEKR